MEELIKVAKRSYILEGLQHDITCTSNEVPQYTFLGSTDRKSYTVRATCQWKAETIEAAAEIEPWLNEKQQAAVVERLQESAKYQFAKSLYDKYFK